jgi:glycosyltransferase involved in cell wall biosynthesis
MKIAFWHFYTLRMLRGIETLVTSLANALARRGAEVSLVTATPTVRPLVTPEPSVRVHAYPTGRYFEHRAIVPFYVYHFLRHRYDRVVVFFSDFGEGAAWRLLRRAIDLPLTLYLCYPRSSVPHRYDAFRRRGWGRRARHILADAGWIAREAEDFFGRPVPVVPVGTDPERFRRDPGRRRALRRQWGFADSDVVLLNVSALERRKGTGRVVQAVGRLRHRFPGLRHVILGQGEEEPALRRAVADLALGERVVFAGVTSRLEEYYDLADVFVMLPDGEANSVACHEAMSSGLPVLVSSSGGFTESVPPDAGLHVDPDQPDQVDAALARLVGDTALRSALGRGGRDHVLAHYTWDRCADRFLGAVA